MSQYTKKKYKSLKLLFSGLIAIVTVFVIGNISDGQGFKSVTPSAHADAPAVGGEGGGGGAGGEGGGGAGGGGGCGNCSGGGGGY